jgi:type III secretion system FlhB-like substrate exporter
MVYRGFVKSVAESFKRNGEEIMTILLKAIDYELCHRLSIINASTEVHGSIEASDEREPPTSDSNVTNDEHDNDETPNDDDGQTTSYDDIGVDRSPGGDMTLCKATKTLGHYARVETATHPMATHEGLLSVLITMMTAEAYYAIPAEARLNSVWIIANLACNTDNMVMMACHPELLVSLITIAARTVVKATPPAEVVEILRAQSIAVRALLNLSWAPENRIPMSENTDLVQVLSSLTIFRQSPKRGRTLQEIIVQTRRQAVGTLRNLAAAPRRNKIFLCNLKNGLLLNVLTDAVLNDVDEGVKKRAFATISNLAVHDTAPIMVEHPALVLVLKDLLQGDVAADDDLKASAHGTLLVLERSITADMECYQNLRELLDALNPTHGGSDEAATSKDVEHTSV